MHLSSIPLITFSVPLSLIFSLPWCPSYLFTLLRSSSSRTIMLRSTALGQGAFLKHNCLFAIRGLRQDTVAVCGRLVDSCARLQTASFFATCNTSQNMFDFLQKDTSTGGGCVTVSLLFPDPFVCLSTALNVRVHSEHSEYKGSESHNA